MNKSLEAAAAAFQFLSRFPVRYEIPFTPEVQQRSVVYYPLVGAAIGAVVCAVGWALGYVLPSLPLAVLLLIAWTALTGGLHLDGLMDSADALLSHRSRDRMLEIMKDSRVGAMGVIACVLVLMLKAALIASLYELAEGAWKAWTLLLVLAPIWSRWVMVYAMFRWETARGSEGLASLFRGLSGRRVFQSFVLAFVLTCAGAVFVLASVEEDAVRFTIGLGVLLLPLAAYIAGVMVGSRINRRLGGLTGDTYGALNELVETLLLLWMVFMLSLT